MKEFIEAFKALRTAPRALWLVVFAFAADAMAYFGVLLLMKLYLGQDVGIRPQYASIWVSALTSLLSFFMLFVGKPTEGRLGIRKSILLALGLSFLGRVVYSSAPFAGGVFAVAISILIVALGEGILQPVVYAGTKQYTTEKTGPMGFAMVYAFMNFGIMLSGPLSAKVRTTFDVAYKAKESTLSGVAAMNWVSTGLTLLVMVVFGLLMTKKAESQVVRADPKAEDGKPAGEGRPPYKDARFMFFIFALLPVRTLFAHQWLTMPEYVLRVYPHEVADNMETIVDSVNPLIIFFGVPTLTALTKRFHVLTMMIIGSLVSAAATFLLVPGASTVMLISYFIVFSIGEALWSSRFYEYAAELAPPGRVAQYMGVASLPWFVAKGTTGLYSGFVLETFIPKDGTQRPGAMWLLYGAIAMLSPLALFAARGWVRAGMSGPKAPESAKTETEAEAA